MSYSQFLRVFVVVLLVGGGRTARLATDPGLLANEGEGTIDYNRDVRPILAENCYACHGPDARRRKARLRLDQKEGALRKLRGGRYAIVPGDTGKSSLVERITSDDEDEVMPPPDSGKKLSAAQIETLRKWIEQGAEWSQHWAYVPLERPVVPAVAKKSWPRTPVDRFILARLETEGLPPSPEADRITQLRRLSFDLIGLPPTPSEVDAFLADRSDRAYEKQVDRLLRSPHYGERMAAFWLDLVRFADTRGYHSDNPRNVYPYRDYVIRSFNENLPFDQFTIEQLAGDLLSEPTVGQRVATCYNKLNQTTEEGGAQAKEYEAKNSSDRVRNVSGVWMGATLGCAECHEHKFDPYEAGDFYRMGAFFADIKEPAIMDRDPGIPVPTPREERQRRQLDARLAVLKKQLTSPPTELARKLTEAQAKWEERALREASPRLGPWHAIGPFLAGDPKKAFSTAYPPEKEIRLDAAYADGRLTWRKREDWVDGKVHNLSGENAATYLYRTIEAEGDASLTLSLGSDDGIRVWINGEEKLSKEVYRGVAPDQEKVTLPVHVGVNQLLMKITNGTGDYAFYSNPLEVGGLPPEIHDILKTPPTERDEKQKAALAAHYRSIAPELAPQRRELADLEKEKKELEQSLARCLVSVSAEPRVVRILRRGDWMDTTGDVVEPAIPAYFGRLDTGERRATRLDLAKWFVSRDNPLTARVFVNRLWKLFFGAGISKRLEDLGAMGEPPVHPELLDWLAVEFVESGWDVKHTIKLLVMSSAYRQSSVSTPELLQRDPYNRLLARQSRWRLDAEMVRDNALAISGLLSRKVGGPSVKPYQPAGYWANLNFPKRKWTPDVGESQYRRGLYTWWQRSFLHPSLMAFDAPNREECTAERPRSNIPQQALVLLNDPTYVEAARVFAYRALKEGGASLEARLRWAFRQAVSRPPLPDELAVLSELFQQHRAQYRADPKAAKELLAVGQTAVPEDVELGELAAWTSVTRALLNLHETVTRN